MSKIKKVSLIFLSVMLFSNSMFSQKISKKTVKKHLYTLASDEMEGRGSGTPGIEKAAVYIENEFEDIGLKTFNDSKNYRQNFKKEGLDLFNVIGLLEGKSKKEEYVVISAHYDHLGIDKNGKDGDSIYNGANDDATGVTAILTLAKYFKKKNNNERSILFVAFTAEEMGLLGSNYFGTTVDADKIVAGINIEMIGKESSFGPKTAWLSGFDRSNFGEIIQKNLIGSEYKLYPDPYPKFNLFFRSDNASLARLGVPAHSFSTTQIDIDKDYHQLSDEAEGLDVKTITETIKAIAIGTESMIKGDDTPNRVVLKK
jgi:Zn-dependent M28 family amino/carboxypeptidase